MKKRKVLVLGDVAVDSCRLPTADRAQGSHEFFPNDPRRDPVGYPGGAFFLKHFVDLGIQSAFGKDHSFDVRGLDVSDFKEKDADAFPRLHWELRNAPAITTNSTSKSVHRLFPIGMFRSEFPDLPWPKGAKKKDDYAAIVFDDLDLGFTALTSPQGKKLWRLLKRYTATASGTYEYCPSRGLNYSIPDLPFFVGVISRSNLDGIFSPESEPPTLWDRLYSNSHFRDRTVAIVSMDTLYGAGVNVSTSLSWERTSQDIVAAIYTHPALKKLSKFRHLIIRVGVTGALHSYGLGKNSSHDLHYIPQYHDAKFQDTSLYGVMMGHNSVVAASVVSSWLLSNRSSDSSVSEATVASVQRNFRLLRDGFPAQSMLSRSAGGHLWTPSSLFRPLSIDGIYSQSQHRSPVVATASVPRSRSSTWSIINEESEYAMNQVATRIVKLGPEKALNQPNTSRGKQFLFEFCTEYRKLQSQARGPVNGVLRKKWYGEAEEKALASISDDPDGIAAVGGKAALRTVAKAVKKQLKNQKLFELPEAGDTAARLLSNCLLDFDDTNADLVEDSRRKSIHTPIEVIGKMTLVDRQEIENFRNVSNLILRHIKAVEDGVCKRPLSIAVFGPPGSGKSFGIKQIMRAIPQVDRHVEELEYNVSQFADGRSVESALQTVSQSTRKKLPVVFFDEFDSQRDGKDLGWLKTFLGPMEDGCWGTGAQKVSFEEAIFVFAGGTSSAYLDFCREDPSITESAKAQFGEAKGPDFVSRLRGHIDTRGVNPSSISDEAYVLRRAIQLRAELLNLGHANAEGEVAIDPTLLHAMLMLPEYKHGGRSLRALVEMSLDRNRRLSKSTVPNQRQLNMHVNGKRFMDMLNGVT